MIYSYGTTQQGYYHIKNNTVCQDAHYIKKVSDELCFAAVADGLGSELYSDIASQIAARVSVEYCSEKFDADKDEQNVLEIIKSAYKVSLQAITDKSSEDKQPIDQYDTTLCLVIYHKEKIYYGHSGDSGIVALYNNGEFKAVTEQQRDENGCVFPLCCEDKWEFGSASGIASVLLATDGMLEVLFPRLLFNEPIPIYVALANFFMDKDTLGFGSVSDEEVQNKMDKFVGNIAEAQVSDDKTVVCVVNSDVAIQKKDKDYYKIPDWDALKKKKDEQFRRLAYPHLYKDENKSEISAENSLKQESTEQQTENTSEIATGDANTNEQADTSVTETAVDEIPQEQQVKATDETKKEDVPDNDNTEKKTETSMDKDTADTISDKQNKGRFINKIKGIFKKE